MSLTPGGGITVAGVIPGPVATVSSSSSIVDVELTLTDAAGSVVRTIRETEAPYCLTAHRDGACNSLDTRVLADGDYALSGRATFGDGKVASGSTEFTVRNPASVCAVPPPAPPPSSIPNGLVPVPWDLAQPTGVERVVATLAELEAALAVAAPGDVVSIVAGTYPNWGVVTIRASGTAAAPLIIRATGGAAIFTGATRFNLAGSHIHVQGLSFHGVTGRAFGVDGESAAKPAVGNRLSLIHCREVASTCLYIEDAVATRFDHSLVERSQTKGIHVANESTRTRIDHNLFRDRLVHPDKTNGFEQVQLGHTTYTGKDDGIESQHIVRTDALVDHNVFQNCQGDPEMIGIKTSGNKIVFNALLDAHDRGHLSFRSSPNNLVFGNVLRDTRGGTRFLVGSNRFMNNLVVDPAGEPGMYLPWGSDTSYQPPNKTYFSVDYIAARHGVLRNNTVVLTDRASSTGIALAEDRQNKGECGTGTGEDDLDCTVAPFDNAIVRNAFVNARGGATVKLGGEFLAKNALADNVVALSNGATLGTSEAMTAQLAPGFATASDVVAARHRALGEHVWASQPERCLRVPASPDLDGAIGAVIELGTCEATCEDDAAEWLDFDMFESDGVTSFVPHEDVIAQLRQMPGSALPALPARP